MFEHTYYLTINMTIDHDDTVAQGVMIPIEHTEISVLRSMNEI